nr:glycoside hydrolase family 2 protein [Bacilli bacterium]
YLLEIETSNGEKYYSRVGFRTINANQYGFFLNEKPLKLRGLNRHQNYPYVGYAMPKSMQEDDAIKLKELGINVVRTSHYPQSEHFLSKCDELGLLVLDEVPGWQHISKEEKWRNHYYDFIKRMVLKERNHPCLFAYGVRIDESKDDHELYQKGNQIAHELDPYRFTIGVRNTRNSELLEDIYGYNDFTCADMNKGLIEPKKITKVKDAPILITEYMGHMEPVKATSDIEKRKQVALRHAKVLDDCLKYERLMGCIGWCFADYYTHVDFGSGDHLCHHGVVDLFRNKKYTASIYESQSDNHPVMDILTNMRPGDFKEATYQDIIVATNMDRIDLYKNDEFVASFYPKHDRFKYLKHPPIYITDILGESFKDGDFTKKERRAITEVMSHGGIYGFGHLKMSHVLKAGKIVLKYHLTWDYLVDIWNKHIATWGGYAKTFTFVGIKDNKEMIKKTIAPSLEFHMNYEYDRDTLKEEDSYDVLPIKVSFVDKDNNVMPYANKPIKVEVEGNISLLGPSLQTLLGGQITLYIRSHGKGKGKVIITSEIEQKEIELQVL